MPIKIMLYERATGHLVPRSQRTVSRPELIDLQVAETPELGAALGHWDAATHYVNVDGEVVAFGDFAPQQQLPAPGEGDSNG